MIWNVYFYFQTTALPSFLSVWSCDFSTFISILLILLYTFLGRSILLYIHIIADFNYFANKSSLFFNFYPLLDSICT